MLAGEGLQPSSKGVRVKFSKGKKTVIDKPFAETKELVAGFWLWQVRSREEAIEASSALRSMTPRSRFARCSRTDDFGRHSPELRKQEDRLHGVARQGKAK